MTRLTRRTTFGLAAGIVAPLAAPLATPRAARAQGTQLAIATGTTGGVYYPLGGGLANLLSRNIPGMSATVEVTGGSVANNQLLGAGRVGLIFSQVDASVDAVNGQDRFRGRPVKVRAIAVLYTNRMQVVTTAAAGINSMADLKGKRVSTGAPGSATEVMAFRLIEAAGLDRDKDFRARERLSPAESTNAIKDGKLDAYFFVSGVPTSAITDLGASPGITLKMVDHAEYVPKITAKYGPVYFPEVIPAGTYPGQNADNHQMSVANILAVLDTMPNELVTKILEVTWNGRQELAQVHAEGRNFALDKQKSAAAGVPWHPAAEAFWKAQGATL
ncbi:TAXI family TRAP transporter solute-binding subunit [Siccirubricoccus phaeus]|uniref:TAXI family TRAP transporter solute-binding subunit n=1 Tax=Siccirubricoccus phaeus TaxID=2595053 RepID=UPI0011F40233|nr:TAXI family TRAP transporter solute-binding subunit [Siccirubricoccus phaeus]